MQNFTLHKATSKDKSLIRQLAAATWNHTYAGVHSQEQLDYMFEQMYSDESLTKQMEKRHTFFICMDMEQPAGYVSVNQKDGDLFVLQKLYISPDYQGKGVGKYLFNAAISHIKQIHPSPCTMELTVNRQNPAIQFYERMGMKAFRESDEPIGNGYFMNCLYMRMKI